MSEPGIVVDLTSGVAPWRQIRDQVAALTASGRLAVGSRLPSIRQLAADLGLSPGTVARAYRELEAAGTLRTARRHGTVVAATAPPRPATAPARPLAVLADEFVATALAAGVPVEDAVAAVRAGYEARAESFRTLFAAD